MTSSIKFTFLMLLAMFLWGGGWTALKILTESVSVEVVSLWRFVIMFISFIPILIFSKKPLRLPKKGIKHILFSSLLNVSFMIFAYLGVKYSSAGSGGVIITILSPLFTFALTLVIFKDSHAKRQYLGLLIGLIGGAIMLNLQDFSSFIRGGELYFIFAAMIWAGVTLVAQNSHQHVDPLHYSFFISAVSMLILFVLTIPSDITIVFEQDIRFWIALLYLGILGQTVATTIFFVASGKLGSARASSFMFLVPLFALLVSYIVLDEEIRMHIVVGGTISLIAVYFINKRS